MNEDNLEKFIKSHRSQLDRLSPPLDLWSKIEQQLPEDRAATRSIDFRTLMIAASMLIIMGVGIIMGLSINQNVESRSGDMAEIQDAEEFYTQRVSNKLHELKAMGVEHDDFREDLDQLDEVYIELKAELEGLPSGNSEIVLQALIQNYKAKILLLERIQARLTDSSETLNITKMKNDENIEI